jgi:hypothetical protein
LRSCSSLLIRFNAIVISLYSKAERKGHHSVTTLKDVSRSPKLIFRTLSTTTGKRLRPVDEFQGRDPKRRQSPTRSAIPHSELRNITRCTSGHSFYSVDRSSKTQCPFCDEFLSEFSRLASSRHADLLSTNQAKSLKFSCRLHKQTFTLTVQETRKGDRWCSLCKDLAQHSPRARDLPRRIVDAAYEQAHLLDSAKSLFNNRGPRAQPRQSDLNLIQSAAKRDPHYAANSSQTLCVHAASCTLTGEPYWRTLTAALDLKLQSHEQIYRYVARHVHPDKCSHPLAAEAFKRLSSEHKQLSR